MGEVATMPDRSRSVTVFMAEKAGMDPAAFEQTLRATVFPANAPREAFAAFLLVAKQYNLNPVLKEIYAFPAKGGGIVPIVSIDGWMNLINSHPAFDGMDFEETASEDGALVSIRCTIYRKDRSHPISITEHLSECVRNTDPWKMKHRMLRHKAAIQCARYAFGFAGIYEEDEAERIVEARPSATVTRLEPPIPPEPPMIEASTETPPAPPVEPPVPPLPPEPDADAPPAFPLADNLREACMESVERGDAAGIDDAWARIVAPHEASLSKEQYEELSAIANGAARMLAP